MSGTSAAACVSNRHTGRRWNRWNLFPRNSWSICKILILNSNQEICLLHRFYGYEVLALFLKCVRKGSTGSTHGPIRNIVFVTPLTKICWLDNECNSALPATGSYGKDPRTGNSDDAQHSHSEFPECSKCGARGSFSVRSLAGYSDPRVLPAQAKTHLQSIGSL